MYGRPERFAFSCLRAFDNSIIPIRCDRSISVSKGFSDRFRFFFYFTIHWSVKIFEEPKGYTVPLRSHFSVVKKRGSRASHTGVTISNSFLPRPVDFKHGHRKWNAENDGASLFNRHIPRAVGLISQAWETRLEIKFAASRRHGVIPPI